MSEDLLTIIGMVICLIFIIYLGINYFKISEGIDSEPSKDDKKLVTSPTGALTPETFAKNISEERDKIKNLLNIKTHKSTYEDIVSDMTDYYDHLILMKILEATPNKSGEYILSEIALFKLVKDALIDTNGFLDSN
jgi:hypothetical protein